jgi:succinate-semialdehyde dehydrogenase / glutarate-semialdehyde dehydrogenase
MSHPSTLLLIDGEWRPARSGETLAIVNPATEETIGSVARASQADLDEALDAAKRAFPVWRAVSPLVRSDIMRKAAGLLRSRAEAIAAIMTAEQGKPLAEAKIEINASAEIIEWFAEEGRRSYGRVIPARAPGVHNLVLKEPVGPVACFTPWNFPISQAARKLGAALAAGCSVIIKPPEETPASPAALVQAFIDAGVPAGVINVVYGVPAEISGHLIPHPVIRKISFTGSTPVGKQLAALAGAHMKRITMELGGHAPAIVFNDANVDKAVDVLAAAKFRNAGQVCIAPTRFLIQRGVYDRFVERLTAKAESITVGDGAGEGVTMGALANERRLAAVSGYVEDAVAVGAQVRTGGRRIGNKGHFYAPTVLTDVPLSARAMNEEPFGPLALVRAFDEPEEALTEANRLPYGLAAYAFTTSTKTASALSARVESGMLSVNHFGIAIAETPFGGVKDSGYGSEGGSEAVEAYLATKFVTQADA